MNHLHRLLFTVASAAFFVAPALAQSGGTVTSNAFAVGQGAGKTGFASVLCAQAQIAIGQNAAKPICAALSGDVTMTAAGVTAIGASKVTNAMLATMAANTTKCNATAGTANPTNCNASTMRTNIGVAIGTNVQAWDTDLDCLAGLSSTGVIKRTGSGTCSAGAAALSDLATGTQDTVIGYFGSTTASASSVPNCTGALTYSTTTHTFGCNVSAGTGTVTQVNTSGLATGGPITATGTVTVTAASKSDQQTGSSTTTVVTPAQAQSHDAAAKAWIYVSQTGGTYTTQISYNMSASKTGTGQLTLTFSTAFASSTSYALLCNGNEAGSYNVSTSITNATTAAVTIRNSISGAAVDSGFSCVAYGRQ